jgi:plastocyanin
MPIARTTLALLLLAAPLAAQAPAPERVTVTLSSFAFAPATLTLRHGQPYVLRLENSAGGGHNFAAPEFFAAARIDPRDQPLLRRGAVEVEGKSAVDIRLVAPPTPGRYALRCTHFLHTGFGMKGAIVVE